MMEIDLETIVGWMGQLDPSGTLFDPCDPNEKTIQMRGLLDGLNKSMQDFLRKAGYQSRSGGWVKE